MNIQSLHITPLLVPMAEPHRTASGEVGVSPLVAVQVFTDARTLGEALVFTYTPAALKPVAELLRNLAPLVEGQALAPAALWEALHSKFKLLGTQGLVGMALAGLDMALWDAHARANALPLHALLGAGPKPLRPYAPVGFDGELGSASAAERWAKQGFLGVKAKIGYASVQQDVAVIRAMKAAAGHGVAVMVDYNQSLDPTEAAARLAVLDAEGLGWVEEPVAAHDFAALAQLAARTQTPLQAGENWWGPHDFRMALNAGVRDLLMPDVMKGGGVTGWLRIASMAAAYGVPVSNHLWPELSAHLLAATPTAGGPHGWLEWADWWNPLLQTPLTFNNGMVDWSGDWATQPGSGMALNADALQRFAV